MVDAEHDAPLIAYYRMLALDHSTQPAQQSRPDRPDQTIPEAGS